MRLRLSQSSLKSSLHSDVWSLFLAGMGSSRSQSSLKSSLHSDVLLITPALPRSTSVAILSEVESSFRWDHQEVGPAGEKSRRNPL